MEVFLVASYYPMNLNFRNISESNPTPGKLPIIIVLKTLPAQFETLTVILRDFASVLVPA